MAQSQSWSVTLVAGGNRHPRWLDENGHFSSDPARALRLVSPDVAVKRVQTFMALHGWDPVALERLRLVPSPLVSEARSRRSVRRRHLLAGRRRDQLEAA